MYFQGCEEFDQFVHLLDKLLSENINKKFFQHDVPYEVEEARQAGGKIIVREKGTIQLLSDWLDLNYKAVDQQPIDDMLATIRKIRKARQTPAHAIGENVFDQAYISRQRDMITEAWRAVNVLRQMLSHHPSAREYKVPGWLDTAIVFDY